jgi:N-acetylglucosamine-6-phosphate deacetylase
MCLALGDLTAEIICDGIHVHPLLIRLAARALGINRIMAITDSMKGTGLPDGTYLSSDGRKFYTSTGDAARIVADNTIIGSTLTMNIALKNLVEKCGFSLPEASKITSLNPARVLGCEEGLGSIKPGKSADIAVLNPEFECLMTLREGEVVYEGG